MRCPRCNTSNFVEATYESIAVDRCQDCQGVWLDHGEILSIVSIKEKEFNQDTVREAVKSSFQGVPKAEKDNVLSCPKCSKEMTPINYTIQSGVIVDRCDEHGLWLDKHELENVQAYREYWSHEVEKHQADFTKLLQETEKKREIHNQELSKNHSFLFTLAQIFSRFM